MNHSSAPPRIAVLVDLPRGPQAGGHVKFWERIAAAARSPLPFDLTVYFSGSADSGKLAPHVRLRQLPPVFSTARLKFLQDIPDHTDLARHHARLAKELQDYDVLHATDGFFAFAQSSNRAAQMRLLRLDNGCRYVRQRQELPLLQMFQPHEQRQYGLQIPRLPHGHAGQPYSRRFPAKKLYTQLYP